MHVTDLHDVPEGFIEVARFERWVDIYSASGFCACFEGREIIIIEEAQKKAVFSRLKELTRKAYREHVIIAAIAALHCQKEKEESKKPNIT